MPAPALPSDDSDPSELIFTQPKGGRSTTCLTLYEVGHVLKLVMMIVRQLCCILGLIAMSDYALLYGIRM